MAGHDRQLGGVPSSAGDRSDPLEPLRAAFREVGEPERYRLLASLLSELAEQSRGEAGSRESVPKKELEVLARKVQVLGEEKASLEDALKTAQADLTRGAKQLEAEQTRGKELQQIINDQGSRLESTQKDFSHLEAELVAKNAELHKAQVRDDELTLKLQRTEFAGQDHSKLDALELDKRQANAEIEELRGQLEQLRLDKEGEIDRVKGELRALEAAASQGGDTLLATLWQRLASADPPVAEGHVPPNVVAAERLFDAFLELLRFVDDIDKGMRPFLGRFTQDHPSVKVPWDAFAKGDDLYSITQRTLAPKGGRPIGVLKMRLRLLYSWIHAAVWGCDGAIESVASELHSQLRGAEDTEWDFFKSTIREYDRADGPERFQEWIRKVRSEKLAEAFGRGG